MRKKTKVDCGGGDLKLIKIKLLALIISPCFVWANSLEGIQLNNEAVQLLVDAIESMKKSAEQKAPSDNKKSYLDSLLEKTLGGEEPKEQQKETEEGQTEKGKEQDVEKDKDKKNQFGMTDGLSEEQKKQVEVNQELVYNAYKKTLEATIKNNNLSEVRMNLGLAFEMSGDLEKAEKAYNMADKFSGEDKKLSFIAKYNVARVLGMQQKIPEALAKYQQALEIVPESKEVKVNIELLLRQQQGGGGGGGDDQQDKDGEGEGESDQPPPDAPPKENPKNNEYKPQNLSKDDVKKILEELKNQEQNIREKEYKKGEKEQPKDKDW